MASIVSRWRSQRAGFTRCPTCDGRGTWRRGTGPDPRPSIITIDPNTGQSISVPGDSEYQRIGGPWFVQCGHCRGTGWTTFGRRVGRRGWRKAGLSWGRCYRCKTPWAFVEGHSTPYRPGSGCFPLCEACWGELTPEERLPFYERLLARWDEDRPVPDDEKQAIRDAVLAGG